MVWGSSFVYSETKARLVLSHAAGRLETWAMYYVPCEDPGAISRKPRFGAPFSPSRAPRRFRYVKYLNLFMRLVSVSYPDLSYFNWPPTLI